jgi:hypothetical protein
MLRLSTGDFSWIIRSFAQFDNLCVSPGLKPCRVNAHNTGLKGPFFRDHKHDQFILLFVFRMISLTAMRHCRSILAVLAIMAIWQFLKPLRSLRPLR